VRFVSGSGQVRYRLNDQLVEARGLGGICAIRCASGPGRLGRAGNGTSYRYGSRRSGFQALARQVLHGPIFADRLPCWPMSFCVRSAERRSAAARWAAPRAAAVSNCGARLADGVGDSDWLDRKLAIAAGHRQTEGRRLPEPGDRR
jgi:hypothetical protein